MLRHVGLGKMTEYIRKTLVLLFRIPKTRPRLVSSGMKNVIIKTK